MHLTVLVPLLSPHHRRAHVLVLKNFSKSLYFTLRSIWPMPTLKNIISLMCIEISGILGCMVVVEVVLMERPLMAF